MPTFTDLLKFKLIFNVKDYSSPIQEEEKEIIPLALKDFCKRTAGLICILFPVSYVFLT